MKTLKGFSLIEMSVVLVIVGLLVGSLIVQVGTQIDYSYIKENERTLEQVKEALLGYVTITGVLPYPASNPDLGTEDSSNSTCTGYLPWATLGVAKEDAWGRSFRYRCNQDYATSLITTPLLINTTNDLTVQLRDGTSLINSGVAVVFSLGKNGSAEADNNDNDKVFTQDGYVPGNSSIATFDDNLIWLSKTQLVNRLVMAGRLKY